MSTELLQGGWTVRIQSLEESDRTPSKIWDMFTYYHPKYDLDKSTSVNSWPELRERLLALSQKDDDRMQELKVRLKEPLSREQENEYDAPRSLLRALVLTIDRKLYMGDEEELAEEVWKARINALEPQEKRPLKVLKMFISYNPRFAWAKSVKVNRWYQLMDIIEVFIKKEGQRSRADRAQGEPLSREQEAEYEEPKLLQLALHSLMPLNVLYDRKEKRATVETSMRKKEYTVETFESEVGTIQINNCAYCRFCWRFTNAIVEKRSNYKRSRPSIQERKKNRNPRGYIAPSDRVKSACTIHSKARGGSQKDYNYAKRLEEAIHRHEAAIIEREDLAKEAGQDNIWSYFTSRVHSFSKDYRSRSDVIESTMSLDDEEEREKKRLEEKRFHEACLREADSIFFDWRSILERTFPLLCAKAEFRNIVKSPFEALDTLDEIPYLGRDVVHTFLKGNISKLDFFLVPMLIRAEAWCAAEHEKNPHGGDRKSNKWRARRPK